MGILRFLFGRRRREDLAVVLYTRQGCHLCEDAWRELERLQAAYRFDLTATDIDADPALVAKFDTCVPVVAMNGKVRLRGRFNAILFQRLLDAR